MLILPPSVRVFVAAVPADMRKSFDGLTALTRELFGQDPVATGHLYVFRNKPGDRIKVLYFSRNGLVIFYNYLSSYCASSDLTPES
jgi:transposase